MKEICVDYSAFVSLVSVKLQEAYYLRRSSFNSFRHPASAVAKVLYSVASGSVVTRYVFISRRGMSDGYMSVIVLSVTFERLLSLGCYMIGDGEYIDFAGTEFRCSLCFVCINANDKQAFDKTLFSN